MRGVPRWLAVLAVLAIVGVVGTFTLHRALTPAALILEATPTGIPADGFACTELKLHSDTGRYLNGLHVEIENPHRAIVDSVVVGGNSAVISVRSGVLPGESKL